MFGRRPWVVIIAAMLLLSLAMGAALIGRQRPVIDGTFVAGPAIADGRIVNAVALPDGRIVVRVNRESTR